jgi:hypothetical protein
MMWKRIGLSRNNRNILFLFSCFFIRPYYLYNVKGYCDISRHAYNVLWTYPPPPISLSYALSLNLFFFVIFPTNFYIDLIMTFLTCIHYTSTVLSFLPSFNLLLNNSPFISFRSRFYIWEKMWYLSF